eukprot:CAMPEP_0171299154 /NCGR_PEP_ID=MMETSP0816-20121228/7942_1 /TAXON_ID=420281 /ORGANISM="Proboscia inermis, Strain CCAP1064/1" /LENGTH=310 /DNA_ID=CAMNT_0011774705 /DNA_START=418 /DNA_END=1347 /DNA_ORIENTATION=-
MAYWSRYMPMTLGLMRFSLNQLQVYHPPSNGIEVTKVFHETTGVFLGVFLRIKNNDKDWRKRGGPRRVIFWIYGGAYLSGDIEGNLGIAEKYARECNCDVFMAQHRLLPEHDLEDAINDIYDAYHHIVTICLVSPLCIQLLGISSGGGLAVLLMQRLAKEGHYAQKNGMQVIESEEVKLNKMPLGAVLMNPFVDYTEPVGSMKEYQHHDLIVNNSVYEEGIPYLAIKLGCDENRRNSSPVYGNFDGLPPMCIVISEHECCYDQNVLLVNRAREAGVECTFCVWKYMCHVFAILSPFIPEGKMAQDYMCEW